jgi:hypothetical protein
MTEWSADGGGTIRALVAARLAHTFTMPVLQEEIARRRTFAIISHPNTGL